LAQARDADTVALVPSPDASLPDAVLGHPRVVVLPTEGHGISRKRNRAIEAFPDVFCYACLDSDAWPEEGWLQGGVAALLADPEVWLVGGPDLAPEETDWRRRAVAAAERSFLVGGERAYRKRRSPSAYVSDLRAANLFLRREAVDRIGAFDEGLPTAEDAELCQRVAAAGKRMLFAADVVVRHRPRALTLPYLKQKVALGYGAGRLLFGPSRMPAWRRLAWTSPLLVLLCLGLGWIPALAMPWALAAWSAGSAAYALACLLQAARVCEAWRDLPAVIWAVAIGNLSPGLGLLGALVRAPLPVERFYRNDGGP
jgi:cellulose synthase/poly-beta-1,6-N-acetylglucosamine synthase-like glycosyltransferase